MTINQRVNPRRKLHKNNPNDKKVNAFNYFGLSTNEKLILDAAKIARNISRISRMTRIPRTSLLYMLKKLERRELVKTVEYGKRKFWKTSVRTGGVTHIKSLEKLESNIVTYIGIPEIFRIFEELIEMSSGQRLLALQPDKSVKYALRKVPVKQWLRVSNEIKNNRYVVEGIVHEKSVDTVVREMGNAKANKLFGSFIGRLEDYVKIPDEFADVESEIYIFKSSAYVINWNKEIAIGIHDKEMVALLLAMFSCVKELGTRYSQNAKMRERLTTPPNKPL